MARLDIPVNTYTRGSAVVPSAGTVDATDGVSVPLYGYADQVLIVVDNTGDPGTISIVPGSDPPAITSALGTVEIACGGTAMVSFMVETARSIQSDGDLDLNFSTGMTGSVYAYNTRVPGVA